MEERVVVKKKIRIVILIIFPTIVAAFLVSGICSSIVRERKRGVFLSNVSQLEAGTVVRLEELAVFAWNSLYVIQAYSGPAMAEILNERYPNLNVRIPFSQFFEFLFIKDGREVVLISNISINTCHGIRGRLDQGSNNYFYARASSAPSGLTLCAPAICYWHRNAKLPPERRCTLCEEIPNKRLP